MSKRRWFALLCALFAAVVASGIADVPRRDASRANDEPRVCEEYLNISVVGVRASKGEPFIDPSIAPLWKLLSFTGYAGFTVLERETTELTDGDHHEFQFGLERRLRLDLRDHSATAARVRIRLYAQDGRKQLDTTVAIRRNRTFMVAGPKIGDDVVILPVTAMW